MEGQIVNEKESGSQQCVLPCPLEGASPRQLKAVSNAKQIKKKKDKQVKNPPGPGWHKGSLYISF